MFSKENILVFYNMVTLEQIQNFKGKYPKQIWSLFFSEMWERFCFYGMRGMLVFFMIDQLNFEEKIAYTEGYKQLGLYAVIAGVLLIIIAPMVRKLMQDVK